MKPEQMNPKAREAFGKSLIDIGVGIYKQIMLFITLAPMALLIKDALDGTQRSILWADYVAFVHNPVYFCLPVLLFGAIATAEYFRKEGIRHIHEIEANPIENSARETAKSKNTRSKK